MTPAALKKAVKQAVIEAVGEERHRFASALVEALEDAAPDSAIRAGRNSKPVRREQVLRAQRGGRRSSRSSP